MGTCFSKPTTEPQNTAFNNITAKPPHSNVPVTNPSITTISPIEALIQSIKNNFLKTLPDDLLYIPLQGRLNQLVSDDQPPFALDAKVKELLGISSASSSKSAYKVILLLGEAGTGKSLFSQNLALQLWQAYQPDHMIPLFISLPQLNNPTHQAVEETLSNYGLTPEQIHLLKQSRSFIFILDGYDELHQWQNLYMTNQLNEWQAKVVTTCRSQALYQIKDYEKYFTPFQGDIRQSHLLNVLYTAPFSNEQIEAYLQQYSQVYQKPIITFEQLSAIPGLNALINNPFLLHLTVEALPDILAHYQSQAAEQSQDITRAALYDVYVEGWFNRQEQKLKASGHIEKNHDPKPEFWQFCKNIALAMQQAQTSSIHYNLQQKSQLFSKKNVSVNAQADPWAKFFALDKATELLRSACLLHETKKQQYAFLHASFIDYFVTRDMYEELTTPNKPEVKKDDTPANTAGDIISQRLLVKNKQMLAFLADRVGANPAFTQKLWNYIEQSKQSDTFAIAAANAISILNVARETFTEFDFSRIKIPGADLSNSVCDHTKFTDANLQGVNFTGAWLQQASFMNANMHDNNFGEYPSLLNHRGGVRALAYSPNKRWLAVAGVLDLCIYDANSTKLIDTFDKEKRPNQLAFATDNLLIVAGYKSATIWDIDKKTIIHVFDDIEKQMIASIAHDQVNLLAYVGNSSNTVNLLDTTKKIFVHGFEGHTGHISCVAFGPGNLLVSGSWDGTVRLWDVANKKSEHVFEGGMGYVYSVAFGSGNLLAAGQGGHGKIVLRDFVNKTLIHVFEGHAESIKCLAFGPKNFLASGSQDNTVRLWDTDKKTLVNIYAGHVKEVTSVAFSPNGILTSGGGDSVCFWDINQETLRPRFEGHSAGVHSVSIGAGDLVASGSYDQTVRLWDIAKKKLVHVFKDAKIVGKVAVGPDNLLAYSGADSGYTMDSIYLCDTTTKSLIHRFVGHDKSIRSMAFSQNYLLALGCEDNTIRLWDIKNKTLLQVFEGHEKAVRSVAFGPDNLLASGSEDQTMRLWDLNKKTQLHKFDHKFQVYHVAFGPNNLLVSATFNEARLWNIKSKTSMHVFELPRSPAGSNSIESIAFSPNHILAVGSDNGAVYLFDVLSRTCLATLVGFTGKIFGLAWGQAPADNYLVVGSADAAVRCWQVTRENENIKYVLRWANQPPTLTADGADLHDAIGLSELNYNLLKQRGGKGEVKQLIEAPIGVAASASSAELLASHGLFQSNVNNIKPAEASSISRLAEQPGAHL